MPEPKKTGVKVTLYPHWFPIIYTNVELSHELAPELSFTVDGKRITTTLPYTIEAEMQK